MIKIELSTQNRLRFHVDFKSQPLVLEETELDRVGEESGVSEEARRLLLEHANVNETFHILESSRKLENILKNLLAHSFTKSTTW